MPFMLSIIITLLHLDQDIKVHALLFLKLEKVIILLCCCSGGSGFCQGCKKRVASLYISISKKGSVPNIYRIDEYLHFLYKDRQEGYISSNVIPICKYRHCKKMSEDAIYVEYYYNFIAFYPQNAN
jgi:hypothetical protein